METTAKRISLALTAGDLIEVKALCEYYSEHQTSVIKRALVLLHYITFHSNEITLAGAAAIIKERAAK